MSTERQLDERAIVIGAGMGGLMAAGVLARYFAEVVRQKSFRSLHP